MAENRELALVLKLVADQFQSELKKSGELVGEFTAFIKSWQVQLAAAGGAVFAVVKSTANYGEELLKTSQKTGVNIQALAGLQHAANLADLSSEQLAIGLKFLSQNMVEASQRTGDGEALFRRLGLSATTATGELRPTHDVLLDLADVFAKSADGAGKTEAAVKLFGRAGIDLIPFLNQGKAGIQALMVEAQRLGLVMSKEDAEAANQLNDELKKLTAATRGLTNALGKELIPSFVQLVRVTTEALAGGGGWVVTKIFQGLASSIALATAEIRAFGVNWDALIAKFNQPEFSKIIETQRQLNLRDIYKEMNERVLKIFPEQFGIVEPVPRAPQATRPPLELGTVPLRDNADETEWNEILNHRLQAIQALIALFPQLTIHEADELQLHNTAIAQKVLDEELFTRALEAEKAKRDAAIMAATRLEIQLRDEALQRERDGLVANAQAWLDYDDSRFASGEDLYLRRLDLLEATLGQELKLNQDQAAELLATWKDYEQFLEINERQGGTDERTIAVMDRMLLALEAFRVQAGLTAQEFETLRLKMFMNLNKAFEEAQLKSDDFFVSWSAGMRRYVRDTQSGFGLGADMARRTAQAMEQGFRNFFFDAMEGKIQSLKDLFRSLLDFAKQIIAQVAAQLLTIRLVSVFGGISPSSPNPVRSPNPAQIATGGMLVRRFASGGPVFGFGNQDTVPALLTPGEFVLSRKDVGDIKRGVGNQVEVIINNYSGGQVETSQVSGSDGRQQIYVTIRETLRGMVRGGDMDGVFGQRFGLHPRPTTR